jgi:hypothetical protein
MHLRHIARSGIAFAVGFAIAAAIATAESSTTPPVLPNHDQERVTDQPQPAPPHPCSAHRGPTDGRAAGLSIDNAASAECGTPVMHLGVGASRLPSRPRVQARFPHVVTAG